MLAPLLAAVALPLSTSTELELTYLANEGFLVSVGDEDVLIDAFVGEPYAGYPALSAAALAQIERASGPFADVELALTSHVHGDHFQAATACAFLAAAPDCVFASTEQVLAELATQCAPSADAEHHRLLPRAGHTQGLTVGEIRVDALRLSHGSGRFESIQNLGHVISIGGFRVLHLGDAHIDPRNFAPYELAERAIDVALVPYWYFQNPAGRSLARSLGARALVAVHVPDPELDAVAALLERAEPSAILFRSCLESRTFPPRAAVEPRWSIPRAELEPSGALPADVPERALHPAVSSEPDEWTAGRSRSGELAAGDLAIVLRAAWNDAGLTLEADWSDDAWDTRAIARDASTWTSPDGRRLDRMYAFDGCQVRLVHGATRYAVWLAPHADERAPLQWHLRRDGREVREVPAPRASLERRADSVGVRLHVPWRDLGFDPAGSEALDLTCIVIDVDVERDADEAERLRRTRHVAWSGSLDLAR